MAQSVTVQLIRHAPTRANMERKYLGWSDESIVSREQLPVIDVLVEQVFGSDLKRCEETAATYFPNAKYVADARFRECHFGDFELQTYEQLKDCETYQYWIAHYETVAPPNGESLPQLIERVEEAFRSLPEDLTNYVIVAHGGSIRALLIKYAPEKSGFWDWKVKHDEIYVLKWSSSDSFKEGKRCTSISVAPITGNEHMLDNC